MGIYYILLRRISSGANNCVQRVFDKNVFYNDISPPFKMFIIQWKIRFLWFKKKFKKVNNVNLFSQRSLIIFTKDADIFGHDCTFIVSFTDEGRCRYWNVKTLSRSSEQVLCHFQCFEFAYFISTK